MFQPRTFYVRIILDLRYKAAGFRFPNFPLPFVPRQTAVYRCRGNFSHAWSEGKTEFRPMEIQEPLFGGSNAKVALARENARAQQLETLFWIPRK